jgi:hypothetical protein
MFLFVLASSLSLFALVIRLIFKSEREVFSLSDLIEFPNRLKGHFFESNYNFFRWKIHMYFMFICLFGLILLFATLGIEKFSSQRIPVLNVTDRTEYRKILPNGMEIIDSTKVSHSISTYRDSLKMDTLSPYQ